MEWPLVGREPELERVAALRPDAGGAIVAGAAGVGKTRLAREIARAAAEQGRPVEWVRATRSAASIPLGAFAALLPPSGDASAELLARARTALAERSGGRPPVLCVDDGQLLDDASATLVHQLVASGEAFAVVTLRRGEPAPDALQALWKDELCALIELDALAPDAVAELLDAALGGPVDGRTRRALWELTRGNALFLRELVLYGTGHGLLTDDGGVWRWRGEPAAGARLAELVGTRLDDLDAGERAALEVVAVGAPVEAAALTPAALEALERHQVVEHRADGRRRVVDVAHPLHGEVVRAGLNRTRLEAIQRRLADAVAAHGARRRDDAGRLAAWRLDTGDEDPALFERAAADALAALDWDAAERFARAAGGSFEARLTLGRALAGAGRAEEADDVLRALAPPGDAERAELAVATARNRFWALGGAAEADAVLREAQAAVSEPGPRAGLLAQRVRLRAAAGHPHEALAEATGLLQDEHAPVAARLHAAVAATEALIATGRSEQAIALTEVWEAVSRREAQPLHEGLLRSMRAFALRSGGRLPESTALAEDNYARLLPRRSAQATAVEAAGLGYAWLARGRPRTALRLLRESAALLRDADPVGMLAWALAGVVQAAAQAGDAAEARAALGELERRPLGHKGFEGELFLARAWSLAADGELSRARQLAREGAEHARERGQHAYELRALHELCRLGEREPIAADRVDGPFAPVAAAHSRARDGAALLAAAEQLAELGMLLAAAEAADTAANAHLQAGRAASARKAADRASAWLARCEGARPPTLLGVSAAELTPREREIALLAAGGLSSREIADRLVVSVRTVDNHLQRAYRKLGVSARQELTDALS